MFKLYTLNIANNKSCYTKNAYKIFFIILELIRIYQLSSLFQIIILLKKAPGGVLFSCLFLYSAGMVAGFTELIFFQKATI